MIVQILLTLGFFILALCGWLRMGRVRFFASILAVICLIGIYFIWVPENLTHVANLLGVGRGADLLLYIFLTYVMFEFLVIRIRDKENSELLTKLVRRLAIKEANLKSFKKTENE